MKDQVTYSLCPSSLGSWDSLLQLLQEFARTEGARLVNRSSEVQKELADLSKGPGVLAASGGSVVMVTIEKPGAYKIVLSNLGLSQKLGMSIRQMTSAVDGGPAASLMDRLKPFWVFRATDGSVRNDPPC